MMKEGNLCMIKQIAHMKCSNWIFENTVWKKNISIPNHISNDENHVYNNHKFVTNNKNFTQKNLNKVLNFI